MTFGGVAWDYALLMILTAFVVCPALVFFFALRLWCGTACEFSSTSLYHSFHCLRWMEQDYDLSMLVL